MSETVYRVMDVLCMLVLPLPIGTNLGMVHLLWMLLSGHLLASRGAIFPGLNAVGLPAPAVRRAWLTLAGGAWTIDHLLGQLRQVVEMEGAWQPRTYERYHPVAVDVTGYWRPRLQGCATTHYDARAGKALPAIALGLVARIGAVGGQRLGLPLAIVRADPADASPQAHNRCLIRQAVQACQRKGHWLPATPPDQVTTWSDGATTIRAEQWEDLVLPNAAPDSPTFTVVAVHDPRYAEPLLLATPLPLTPLAVRNLYRDRWPVEQIPLAAKQMLGAARQFVHAPESCQRWPELTLLAGALVSYLAATTAAVPTGFGDRDPQPTPGRFRRLLARCPFPEAFPFPARVREKASATQHLPKGHWGQRRRRVASARPQDPPTQVNSRARAA